MNFIASILTILFFVTIICWLGNLFNFISKGWGWTFSVFTILFFVISSFFMGKKKPKNDTVLNNIPTSKTLSPTKNRAGIVARQNELTALQEQYKNQVKEIKKLPNIKAGLRFTIDYIDSYGDKTYRKITVMGLSFNEHGNLYIDAVCHLRNENRSFRLDRVEQFYDDSNMPITKDKFLDILGLK